MKISVKISAFLAIVFLVACAKTRTCSCKSDATTTTVTTPRNGAAQPTTSTGTFKSEDNNTYNKIKKSEMKRVMDCNNKTETTSNTYTTIGSVNTVSTVNVPPFPSFTISVPTTYTADVTATTKTDYTCEIK